MEEAEVLKKVNAARIVFKAPKDESLQILVSFSKVFSE
jgi:hypothetical protein